MPLREGAQPLERVGDTLGILVLHGFTGSPVSVRPWAEHLADAGHTVIAPRLPGHGTRWQDLNRTTWTDWYTEAERAAAWLRRHCDTIVAMGLSAGATLALRLAEEHPDVAGVVAVNPVLQTERPEWPYLVSLRRLVPSWPNQHDDIKRPGTTEGAYDRIPLQAAHSLTRLWAVTRSEIDRMTVPLLVYRSADDHVAEPSNVAWLLANVGSTDVEEVMLEDSFHVATLDNDAGTVFSGSLAFARRVAGR
jgi:carboxylesterase